MFTLAELTIKIKAPRTWNDDKRKIFYQFMTSKIEQIAQYARSIDLEDYELRMCFESSELPASITVEQGFPNAPHHAK